MLNGFSFMSIRHFDVLALQQKLCQFVCFAKKRSKGNTFMSD
ncbi:hypothetical protein M083_1751 [Bacteroides fragilis str. 3986 T(B)9]|uniref:Uncharacterized protein n=2 Tax=Bacteroides fragilis TaxID=817 RepID=A0A016AX66_BACFG|nr:hypothetical protein M077_1861 [Bacteroides fragilis str. 2-F-2 \